MAGITGAIEDVAKFHEACDVPISSKLEEPSQDRVLMRIRLIREEVDEELIPAMILGNLVEIADGMADAIYVIIGAALEYGIPLDRIWDAVQQSNMAKVDPVTGKVRHREDGKILKPDGWNPPDIASILGIGKV